MCEHVEIGQRLYYNNSFVVTFSGLVDGQQLEMCCVLSLLIQLPQ